MSTVLIWMQFIQRFIAFPWKAHFPLRDNRIRIAEFEAFRQPIRHIVHQRIDALHALEVRDEAVDDIGYVSA